jgi:hypothetical protein
LERNSLKPQHGLWSAAVNVTGPGELQFSPNAPLDLSTFDLLVAQVAHAEAPARNGQCAARLRILDADGHAATGDNYPVLSTWQPLALDLREASAHDVDLSRIARISLILEPMTGSPLPLAIKTDAWTAESNAHTYLYASPGTARNFFVESRGERIHVGRVGQYEVVIANQGGVPAGVPWMQVLSGSSRREILGSANTGLYLLDPKFLTDGPPRNTSADSQTPRVNARSLSTMRQWAWPASLSSVPPSLHWQVVWTSPVAAIIEGRQEAGGFDLLGEPLIAANWRLMIYQGGQIFVNVRWNQIGQNNDTTLAKPVSWALLAESKSNATGAAVDSPGTLEAIYPATFRQDLPTALPHEMQTHLPIGMIAPSSRQKDNFWWTRDALPETRWIFGAGLPPRGENGGNSPGGEATCMLLVDSPDARTMAASFGQYLVPPKIVVNQGQLDRNFPGDADNDGFVESYGFQVVRLANGRATFTIYPQERPLIDPPILFTVPASEREALDVKHSHLLVNIDGKQFTNPPVFPDGSFLLQVPYVLDRPVNVEVRLVK